MTVFFRGATSISVKHPSLYFDHNATTQCEFAALEAWLVEDDFDQAALWERCQTLFSLPPEIEVQVSSGGTESTARLLFSLFPQALPEYQRPHAIISSVEHPALKQNAELLARLGHIDLDIVAPHKDGQIHVEDIANIRNERTRFLGVMLANNESGILSETQGLGRFCNTHDIWFHCDVVQACGKVPFSWSSVAADSWTLAGHKLGAPTGVGALVHKKLPPTSQNLNWPQPDGGFSEAARALHAALETLPAKLDANRNVERMRDELELRLGALGAEILGQGLRRLPQTSCLRIPGHAADGILMRLDISGIAISAGSACSSGVVEASPVLLAMGLKPVDAIEYFRISLGPNCSLADIDLCVTEFEALVAAGRT